MKVCVLGNSHAACLKAAWDIAEDRPPNVQMTFFAAFWLSLRNLEIDGRHLVPSTRTLRRTLMYTAGQGEVDVSAYDAFLICGGGIELGPVDARVSHQVLRATSSDLLRTSLAYSLSTKIRQISDAPIYVMHNPLSDERTAGGVSFEVVNYADYFPMMEQALDIPKVRLLRQPEQTITCGHYTRLEFSKDAVRLVVKDADRGIRHTDDDFNHMNVHYGAVRLKDFFERLTPK